MREQVENLVAEAVRRVLREIDPAQEARLGSIQLGPARSPEHGDFASNAAMVLAKPLGLAPRALAERIRDAIVDPEKILSRIEIAGPGFLNFFLASARWHAVIGRILRDGSRFGRNDIGRGKRVMVEFVSANPTGPLTIGHGRNAVLGDTVSRLLDATGWQVTREYYFNDAGRQMRVLGESLRARYEQSLDREAALPDEGYQGQYLIDVARALAAEQGDSWLEEPLLSFQKRAQAAIFADIEGTLARLGIGFDVHFNEQSLYETGAVSQALEDLKGKGLVYEKDGAVWLRSTSFGLDRDRVLVKSTGEPTYMLPDVAYHRNKLERGFDLVIDVFGPDHIEQFPYVRAAMAALGYDAEKIALVMYQWVNLRRGGEIVKMSTRKATFVTVDEVLDDVGADAFRYFMVERRADTHLDFDVDLARERSERNPVYKIQYAHARLASIERKAQESGLVRPSLEETAFERLESPAEMDLMKLLERFPDTVEHAAAAREPQEIARYLLDLASAFHSYVSDGQRHRVLSDDRSLSLARLSLVSALRTVLANGLSLLGISAPERM